MADRDRVLSRMARVAPLVVAALVLAACGSAGLNKGVALPPTPTNDAQPSTTPSSTVGTPPTTTSTTATSTTATISSGATSTVSSANPISTAAPSSTTTSVAVKTSPDSTPAGTTMPSTTTSAPPPNSVRIDAVQTSQGTVLTDQYGYTIYLLTADTPDHSNCTSFVCNAVWPAVLATGGGVAGPGVQQSLLGTIPLPDGTDQVTYAGHPLYTYLGDRQPKQTTGQGIKSFGGIWWVLSATTGAAITGTPSIL